MAVFQFQTNRWTDLANELGPGFAARCAGHDETDAFVAENYAALKAHKVFAAGVPEELGGGGATVADLAGMLRTLGHYCSSTALALSMHTHLVAAAAWRWKNQKAPVDGLLKRVANDDLVLVSTGGADWLLGSGKATRGDGGYHVTGRKIFCSGAPAGGLMLTTAVVDDPADGPTVLHISVPTNAPGVKVQNDWKALGMRGTGSHEIAFEDVFVPDAAVAARRPAGKWHPLVHVAAMIALPVFNAVYVGVAEAARDLAIDAARRRRDDRAVQAHAGEVENELTSAQLALSRMIELAMTRTPGVETTVETMCCRAILGRGARATVDKAMDLAGGGSFLRRNALERLFRDIQGVRYHPMQEKPQTVLAGRVALGMSLDD
jgi:alkylation response protein AidB-like acyl-CoA dehydrogenase